MWIRWGRPLPGVRKLPLIQNIHPADKPTLLLTATIAPAPDTPALVRRVPQERADDYRLALSRWSRDAHLFRKLIWLENSAHELSHILAKDYASTVTSVIESGLDYPPNLGKGYGE